MIFGHLGAGVGRLGGSASLTVVKTSIPDATLYASGSYSAYMHPFNVTGVTYADTLTVNPGAFPNGSKLDWNYSGGDSTSVKAFLDLAAYGNYSNTVVPTPIIPCQVQNLSSLTASHDLTFSGTTNYNVIYDLFLGNDITGSSQAFEIEIFIHSSAAAISYFESVTSLATNVTLSGIAWDIAIDTGLSVHDIMFMPNSRADVHSATLDLKAMFAELVTLGALTGQEWYTGHGLGVEAIQGTGSLTVNSVSVSYTAGLPVQANYIPSQDLTNAAWTDYFASATSTQINETNDNNAHMLYANPAVTRAAGVKTFVYQADIKNLDPANARQMLLQVHDSTFGSAGTGHFDPAVPANNFMTVGGDWTNPEIYMAPVPGSPGTYRCMVQFTTDGATTGFIPRFQLEDGAGVTSYQGVDTAGMQVTNPCLFNVGAGGGGS